MTTTAMVMWTRMTSEYFSAAIVVKTGLRMLIAPIDFNIRQQPERFVGVVLLRDVLWGKSRRRVRAAAFSSAICRRAIALRHYEWFVHAWRRAVPALCPTFKPVGPGA